MEESLNPIVLWGYVDKSLSTCATPTCRLGWLAGSAWWGGGQGGFEGQVGWRHGGPGGWLGSGPGAWTAMHLWSQKVIGY